MLIANNWYQCVVVLTICSRWPALNRHHFSFKKSKLILAHRQHWHSDMAASWCDCCVPSHALQTFHQIPLASLCCSTRAWGLYDPYPSEFVSPLWLTLMTRERWLILQPSTPDGRRFRFTIYSAKYLWYPDSCQEWCRNWPTESLTQFFTECFVRWLSACTQVPYRREWAPVF